VSDGLLSSASVTDFSLVATLGVGGFGRVELVRNISLSTLQLYLCNALSDSLWIQTIGPTLPSDSVMTVDAYGMRLDIYFAKSVTS